MLQEIKETFKNERLMEKCYLQTTPQLSKLFRLSYPQFKTECHYIPRDESIEIYLINRQNIKNQFAIQLKNNKVKFYTLNGGN